MRNNSYYYNTPSFSPSFDTNNQQTNSINCNNCLQYEQDIAILQQRLLETHQKYMDEIDKTKQQQIQILNLKQNINRLQQKRQQSRQNKSPGKITSQNQWKDKNQLLKNDLQTMRNKVLQQIMKSNSLRQQLKDIKNINQNQKEKIKKLELIRNKLIHQNQQILQDNKRLNSLVNNFKNKAKKCECGYETKYCELDQAFMNQRTVTNQLIQQNNQLQALVDQLRVSSIANKSNKSRNIGGLSNNINTRIQNQNNSNILIMDSEQKPNSRKRKQKKRNDFEQTKNLIMKLQQAQKDIRTRK